MKDLMFLLLTLAPLSLQQTVDVRCTTRFCDDAVALKPCPALPEACLNATRSFRLLPSPDPCNCCRRCLVYLEEGDECPLGDYGQPPPEAICGPGLTCLKDESGVATCQEMNTTCALAQQQSFGGVASRRPSCDERGLFAPAQCVPNSLCFCVEPYSAVRVFGEAVFQSEEAQRKLRCNCARSAWRARLLLGEDVRSARCQEDGSYEPLQCVAGRCVCVDDVTGEPVPGGTVVDVNELVEGSLPCFDPARHAERRYELPCEREHREVAAARAETQALGVAVVLGLEEPRCAPDGSYDKLQVRAGRAVCVDPQGNQLEDYTTRLATLPTLDVSCNCARARWLLQREGRGDLPRCCPRGDFQAWQCWRGTCFCVDTNGAPSSWDVALEDLPLLPCYQSNPAGGELPCATSEMYQEPPPSTPPLQQGTTPPVDTEQP